MNRLHLLHSTALRVLAARIVAGGGDAPGPVPRPVHPDGIELDYGNRVVKLVADRVVPLYRRIIPMLAEWIRKLPPLTAHARDQHADVDSLIAKRLLEQIRAQSMGVLNEGEMEMIARFYGDRLSVANRNELARQLRFGLGVDVPINEGRSTEIIAHFARENAALIRSIPEHLHQDVSDLVTRAFRKRMSEDTLAAEFEERFGVAENAARFLARDQIGKLNGQLSAERQQQLGITAYKWRTRRDKRVRPEHRRLEGKRFLYEDPPPNGSGGLPGEDYGCRCGAEPDLTEVLDAIEEARAFPGAFSAPLAGSFG